MARDRSPIRLHCRRLTSQAGPDRLVDALARLDQPVLLDSAARDDAYGRFTLLACRPARVLELRDGVLRDSAGQRLADTPEAIWPELDRQLAPREVLCLGPDQPPGPYQPGWFGFVGYEVGRLIETLPGHAPRDTALPDLRLALHDAILLYDARDHAWFLLRAEADHIPPTDAAQHLQAALPETGGSRPATTDAASATRQTLPQPTGNFTPHAYRAAVARAIDYIAAGDIFQVNLSQRFELPAAPPSHEIYRRLRRRNPAWYAAYLRSDDPTAPWAICSSSPELFLRVRRQGSQFHVLTRPIKGTRPRMGDPADDAAAAAALQASPKDNAELAMIIDLLRNDLGRICRYGSVRVTDPCRLETHPTVFHLVGTVEGILAASVGPAGLLRATLPGGSITGAPKIRAMEIIDELEPCARGVYTGCIGTVGLDGSAEWNIAIRTVVCDGRRALVQAGGGIVADSTPDDEYDETLAKARALLEALGPTPPLARPQ